MLFKQALVALIYLLLGIVTHRFITTDGLISIVWPGSGLALAALLLGGKRYIWGVTLGALALSALYSDSLWAIIGMTLASVVEARLAYWLLTRNELPQIRLRTLRKFFRLILLGGGVASVPAALIGVSALLLAGEFDAPAYWNNLSHWWMGDTLGVLLVTSLLLAWHYRSSLSRWQGWETVLLVGITFLVGQVVFLDWLHDTLGSVARGYWMFLFVTWIAVRLNTTTVTSVLMMIAVQALAGALQHKGFFADDIARTGLHNYWFYLLILSLVGMILTIYVNEIKRSLAELKIKDNALNATANAIVITDAEGRIEYTNAAFTQLSGYSTGEVIGQQTNALIRSEQHDDAFYKNMWDTIKSGRVWHGELTNRRKDGSTYAEEMTITPMRSEQGELDHFVAVKQDISQRKHDEQVLRQSEERFRFLLENSPIAVRISQLENDTVVFANQRYAELLNRQPAEVRGAHPSHYYANPQDYREVIERIGNGERVTNKLIELTLTDAQGKNKWVLASYLPLEFQDQPSILGWFYDISDRKAVEDMAQHHAHFDTLTDLPNRRLFSDRLQQALVSAKREAQQLACLFIDLDKFKPINDTYGHDMGDLLLREVAQRILGCLREADTVARIGGDEFVVLLRHVSSAEDALAVADKIRHALNLPFELDGHRLNISSSGGVAMYPEHGDVEAVLMKHADIAMYYAKTAGRDNVQLYQSDMTGQAS